MAAIQKSLRLVSALLKTRTPLFRQFVKGRVNVSNATMFISPGLRFAVGASAFGFGILSIDTAQCADNGEKPKEEVPRRDEDEEDKDESKKDPIEKIISSLMSSTPQITFGGIAGFISASALKWAGRQVCILLGLGFCALQYLSYKQYINVDWQKVHNETLSILDTDGDGKLTKKDVENYWKSLRKYLTYQLPSGSGFATGFLLGIKFG